MLTLLTLACLSPSDPLSSLLGGSSAEAGGVKPLSQAGLLETERNSVDVFAQAAPSTVFVTQSQLVRRWGATDPVEVPAGTGTGVIWDTEGHVVTNFHVVDGASSLEVALHDGSTWPARFIGGEPRKDIAVLQIDAPKELLAAAVLPPVGGALQVGQKVLAIGNPYGLDHTLTVGVVSAVDREILGYGGVSIRGVIQTDASINPGNSGGPLLNSKGQLIGINSQIASASGASAGIGFAVPVDTVRRVVSEVVEFGAVQQAGLGVRWWTTASRGGQGFLLALSCAAWPRAHLQRKLGSSACRTRGACPETSSSGSTGRRSLTTMTCTTRSMAASPERRSRFKLYEMVNPARSPWR